VDYAFKPKPYDILILYLSDGSTLEYTILGIDVVGGKLILNLDAQLSELAKSNLTGNSYRRFLLLSRIKDETNVILNFIKRDGKTSYGFLIADNISSDVLDNIDTITREVKQKLLNDQSVINDINGGTFGP
jgi:cold shock CspA family protein